MYLFIYLFIAIFTAGQIKHALFMTCKLIVMRYEH